jgi:hypothetical protein
MTKTLGAILAILVGCSGSSSSSTGLGGDSAGGGGSGANQNTGGYSAGGEGGVSAPLDPLACLHLQTEEACLAAQCQWYPTWLFEELTCGAQTEVMTCLWVLTNDPFPGDPYVSERSVPEGLLVAMAGNVPHGFTDCDFGHEEPEGSESCACLD